MDIGCQFAHGRQVARVIGVHHVEQGVAFASENLVRTVDGTFEHRDALNVGRRGLSHGARIDVFPPRGVVPGGIFETEFAKRAVLFVFVDEGCLRLVLVNGHGMGDVHADFEGGGVYGREGVVAGQRNAETHGHCDYVCCNGLSHRRVKGTLAVAVPPQQRGERPEDKVFEKSSPVREVDKVAEAAAVIDRIGHGQPKGEERKEAHGQEDQPGCQSSQDAAEEHEPNQHFDGRQQDSHRSAQGIEEVEPECGEIFAHFDGEAERVDGFSHSGEDKEDGQQVSGGGGDGACEDTGCRRIAFVKRVERFHRLFC